MNFQNKKVAFIFPGQGSQKVGMGKELAKKNPIADEVFNRADEILGFKLSNLAWEGPEEELNDTINTQPALMTHSIAVWQVLKELHPDMKPDFTAGHSMGELSALVASGAISFEGGLKLVRRRGELMKQAGEISPGRMAAILGLDISTVEQITKNASKPKEPVQIANDNCPGQVVISGAEKGVDRAIILAKEAGAKRALPLAVSIAAHSELMAHAQEDFTQAVKEALITEPEIPIIGNVSARPLQTIADIHKDLEAQLRERVRWAESIDFMVRQEVDTFLELGSGNVLSGLIKRIDKNVQRLPIGTPDDLSALT